MTIKLSELIEAIGERHVAVQYLHRAAVNAKRIGRGRNQSTNITFSTEQVDVADFGLLGPAKTIGLIVWIDAERYQNAIESIKADQESTNEEKEPS